MSNKSYDFIVLFFQAIIYIKIYNSERLHSALDYLTPDKVYFKGTNNRCYDAKEMLLGVA